MGAAGAVYDLRPEFRNMERFQDVPAEAVTIEGLGDIELSTGGIEISTGGIDQGAADANDMSDDEYQPASAIESIQMEYFMEEN